LATVAALIVAVFDPLGLDQASDRRSVEAADRVSALFYPSGHGQKRITTVSVDEAALSASGREWPPQYDFYAETIAALTADPKTRPSAIFLDFTFMSELYSAEKRDQFVARIEEVTKAADWADEPDCQATPLAKLRCVVRKGGVPVIIGKPFPSDRCDLSLTLVMLSRAAILVPLGWPVEPGASRMDEAWRSSISRDSYLRLRGEDAPACNAVIADPGRDGLASFPYVLPPLDPRSPARTIQLSPRGVARYDLTPSSALFAALCLRDKTVSPHCGDPESRDFERLLRRESLHRISWASIPDPDYLALEARLYPSSQDQDRRERCRREIRSIGRILRVGLAELFADLNDDGSANAVKCPYHADIRQELLTPETSNLQPTLVREIHARFIAGRAVIVGSSHAQSNDTINTPTRGRVPGMVLHAMALDNLLEWGGRMRQAPPAILGGPIDQGEVVELVLTFAMTFLIVAADLSAPAAVPGTPGADRIRRRRLLLTGLAIGGSILVFILSSLVLTTVLRWTPVNIVGLWTLSVVVALLRFHDSLIETARRRGSDLSAWLRALPARRPLLVRSGVVAAVAITICAVVSLILVRGFALPGATTIPLWLLVAAGVVATHILWRRGPVPAADAPPADPPREPLPPSPRKEDIP